MPETVKGPTEAGMRAAGAVAKLVKGLLLVPQRDTAVAIDRAANLPALEWCRKALEPFAKAWTDYVDEYNRTEGAMPTSPHNRLTIAQFEEAAAALAEVSKP